MFATLKSQQPSTQRSTTLKGDQRLIKKLDDLLKEEDEHVDWLEAQLDQINQMGVGLYLSGQTCKCE